VKAEPLGDFRVAGDPVGRFVGLVHRDDRATTVRALDAAGNEVGKAVLGPGQDGIVTDVGIVAVPRAFHGPVRPHELDFFALDGTLRKSVSEPTLRIALWNVDAGGRLVTVNLGPDEKDRTIVVYDPDGTVAWRYVPPHDGENVPDARVSPDGKRLLVLRPDPAKQEVDVALVAPGNAVLKEQRLPLLTEIVFRADGQRVAAVGWGGALLLDASTGEVLWRNAQVGGALKGGLRFDGDGNRVLVVEGRREPKAATVTLRLRRLRVSDGKVESADLGTVPADQVPAVRGIAAVGAERRVVLHDRVVTVPGRAWRAR